MHQDIKITLKFRPTPTLPELLGQVRRLQRARAFAVDFGDRESIEYYDRHITNLYTTIGKRYARQFSK